jgi:hypothetical protein
MGEVREERYKDAGNTYFGEGFIGAAHKI